MITILEELSEPSRRRLLVLLLNGPVSVSALVDATGLKQPNVSNHLARLRARGLVRASKVGRQVFYSLASPEIEGYVRGVGIGDETTLHLPAPTDLMALAEEFADAAARGDEVACGEMLDRALRSGHSLLTIFEDLLGAAMAVVGHRYLAGELDESGEHLASEITMRALGRASLHFGRRSRNDLTALLGCAPGARHVIGLRMIGDYLSGEGWRAIYLGADVPIPAFVATVRQNAPDLVLLACHAEDEVVATVALIRALAELVSERGRPPFLIGVGGAVASMDPAPLTRAGADFIASTLNLFATETLPRVRREILDRLSAESDRERLAS